jgi:hypothetical protein
LFQFVPWLKLVHTTPSPMDLRIKLVAAYKNNYKPFKRIQIFKKLSRTAPTVHSPTELSTHTDPSEEQHWKHKNTLDG